MRKHKYPKPLTAEQAADLNLGQLPKSSRPKRSVKHKTERHSARSEALVILAHPAAYNLFATVPLNQAPGSFPAAVYSALLTLLSVAANKAEALRMLRDDAALMRALLRGLVEHGEPGDAGIVARKGLPSKASWNRFLDLVEEALGGNAEAVREQFRLNALALAMGMGHLDAAGARNRLTAPDPRTFLTADGTVLKSPTDNTDDIVFDETTGQARTKRTDPSRKRHREGGQAEDGAGVTVHGTKFVLLHSHGPAWRDTITLDLAHDSEPRPGMSRGQRGAQSEVALALSMVYRVVEREAVDAWGELLATPDGEARRPFVAGLVYDKALRGVHAEELAKRDLIAVAAIIPERAAREGRPASYRQLPVATVPCDNAPTTASGLPTHVHTLVASRGRVWEKVLLADGTTELMTLTQTIERRPRVTTRTVWYRKVIVDCSVGPQAHTVLVSILEPARPPRQPQLDHMPTPPAPDRPRRRGARQREEEDLSRGEYLRIFAEGEDPYEIVRSQRPAAENRNSELDAAMRDKRIPAYGVYRQTMWMLGFFNGGNIINEHYVIAHAVPGFCAHRLDENDTQVVIVEYSDKPAQLTPHPPICRNRRAERRPAPTRPVPARPRGGRPPNRR